MNNNLDEDLIEATIRRVAEAKAARESTGAESEGALDQNPAMPAAEADVDEGSTDPPAPLDEGAIEATIRRVAAAKAALHTSAAAIGSEPAHGSGPITPLARSQPAASNGADSLDWLDATRRIERELAETSAALRTLVARLDALVPVLQRIAPPDGPGSRTADDGWHDVAPIPRASALTPRPSVPRDSPRTVTSEQFVDHEVIDTRPLPKPLPPLHMEQRRGIDLLPRTYRITVEDTRRGVDLVPLHRALLAMEGVRDMSLLSYNNGIAIVSLETVTDIDPQALERALARAMSREAHVEMHNESTLVVKLAEE